MRFHNLTKKLLGTSARIGVLGVLLAYPSQEFTAREVARQAGVSHPQVLEALRLFAAEGFVQQRRFGRSSVWRADPDHFLCDRMRLLVTLEQDAWREILSRLEKALRKAGATEAYLFGSVAQGTEEPTSDIDVLALFGSDRGATAFRSTTSVLAKGFQRLYGNEVQVAAYGPTDVRRGGPRRLIATARRDGIPLEVVP